MSYLEFREYNVIPIENYRIIRNCSGCGCKMIYFNTNCFRINANGNCLDVWMIYQCSKCKHTYNLPIYERVKPNTIMKEKYNKFLNNDLELAFQYGTSTLLMKKNKIEIDWTHILYKIVPVKKGEYSREKGMIINNTYSLKLRTDKVLSEILGLSRKKIVGMINNKRIIVNDEYCC